MRSYFDPLPLDQILLALSVVAIVTMSLVAVFQSDLKRMFAYSSVAQIGYITLGIALTNAAGLTGAIAHLFNHGVTKGALFLLAGGISLRCGGTSFAAIAGLGQRMPLTSFGIVIAGLSLIGVPATAGFTTKWYLVVGALERGYWWLAALIVSEFAHRVAYVWRFVEAAYLQAPGPGSAAPRRDAAQHAAAGVVDGGCLHLLRYLDVVQHRLRRQCGGASAAQWAMTPEALIVIALVVPVGAAAAGGGKRPGAESA